MDEVAAPVTDAVTVEMIEVSRVPTRELVRRCIEGAGYVTKREIVLTLRGKPTGEGEEMES